jgi:dolichol kinase
MGWKKMVNSVSGFVISFMATMILGIVPWQKPFIRKREPSSQSGGYVHKTEVKTGDITREYISRCLKGGVCGFCFGIFPKATGLSPPSVLFLFLILVIFLYSVPRKRPGNIFLPGMATGVCLILYPAPSLLLSPLILTLALTFYPVVSLPVGLYLVSLLICIFITPTTWGAVPVMFISLFSLGIDIYTGLSAAELGRVRNSCLERLVRRKIYRYCGLVFPLIIYPVFGSHFLRLLLLCLTLGALAVEIARSRITSLNDRLRKIFSPVGKEEEAFHISGTSAYLAGSFMASLFQGPAAPQAMVMLTLGDAWAVLVGKRWGHHPWLEGKTIEGSLACLFISLLSAYSLANSFSLFRIHWFGILLASLAVTLTEAMAKGIWDNLLMAPAAVTGITLSDILIRIFPK